MAGALRWLMEGAAAGLAGMAQGSELQREADEKAKAAAALEEQRLGMAEQRKSMALDNRQKALDLQSQQEVAPDWLQHDIPGTGTPAVPAVPEQDVAGPAAPGQTPGTVGGVMTAPAVPGKPAVAPSRTRSTFAQLKTAAPFVTAQAKAEDVRSKVDFRAEKMALDQMLAPGKLDVMRSKAALNRAVLDEIPQRLDIARGNLAVRQQQLALAQKAFQDPKVRETASAISHAYVAAVTAYTNPFAPKENKDAALKAMQKYGKDFNTLMGYAAAGVWTPDAGDMAAPGSATGGYTPPQLPEGAR